MSAPDNPLLRVLRKHFPDAAALHTQYADLDYNELTFTHDLDVAGVNVEEQHRLLRDLEKHLRLAATAIFALHPRVRQKLEAVHKANVEERRGKTPRLATVDRLSSRSGPPREVVVDAMNLLSRLHLGLLGKWPAADRWKTTIQSERNAIRVTIDHLASLRVETAQARSNKTWREGHLHEQGARSLGASGRRRSAAERAQSGDAVRCFHGRPDRGARRRLEASPDLQRLEEGVQLSLDFLL